MNLVAATGGGDMQRVGTEKVQARSSFIPRMACRLWRDRIACDHDHGKRPKRRLLAHIHRVELGEEFLAPRQDHVRLCFRRIRLLPETDVEPQTDLLQLGRQLVEGTFLASWSRVFFDREREPRSYIRLRQVPDETAFVFDLK